MEEKKINELVKNNKKYKKRDIIFLLLIIFLVISLIFNICTLAQKDNKKNTENIKNINPYLHDFSLLDPKIAEMDINGYIENKENYIASYKPLRKDIEAIISTGKGDFGVYFEDLYSHTWLGINEKKAYKPASLLKITAVSSILSLVESGDLTLNTKVTIREDDLNSRFGNLYTKSGSTFTIKELIEKTLIDSDNTAIRALYPFVSHEKWIETRLAMGLPLVSIEESINGTELSPKEYSRVFHSLYYSGYLSREFSNWMLSVLSNTDFNQGIKAGLPKEVKVSHKIGVWAEEGSTHDCGIIYAKRPYILCIMSKNTTETEGNHIMGEISKKIYEYVSSH